MSWAANRHTDRLEDRAYSLLGIFDVTLPMIYGAGEQAFRLLQEEIIKKSNDQLIFAWEHDFPNQPYDHFGILARSPKAFLGYHDLRRIQGLSIFEKTQLGVSIDFQTLPYSVETYLAVLDCRPKEASNKRIAILVKRLSGGEQYSRVKHSEKAILLVSDNMLNSSKVCFTRHMLVAPKSNDPSWNIENGFHLRRLNLPGSVQRNAQLYSSDTRSGNLASDCVYLKPGLSTTASIVITNMPSAFDGKWSRICWMKFGFDADFNPICLLGNRYSRFNGLQRLASSQDSFSKAAASAVNAPERQSLFDDTWTRSNARGPTLREKWPHGFMILKGDRHKGIDRRLEGLNLSVSIRLLPCHNPSTATFESTSRQSIESKVWTVDITELGRQTPESRCALHQASVVLWWLCLPFFIFTIILCPVGMYTRIKLLKAEFSDEDGAKVQDV